METNIELLGLDTLIRLVPENECESDIVNQFKAKKFTSYISVSKNPMYQFPHIDILLEPKG